MAKLQKFPSEDSVLRLRQYSTFERLLEGNHYSAYLGELGDKFSDKYRYLRYLQCNFAGLLSKVIADVLFGEKVMIESKDKNDDEQEFISELIYQNKLDTQLYESALFNSARGDAVFRIRVDDDQIKIDDINPAMYFPEVSENFRDDPQKKVLAWKNVIGEGKNETTYLIKEIHTPGLIEMEIYEMKGKDNQEISRKVAVKEYNELAGTDHEEKVDTGIEEIPIVHIPNFRINNQYFGVSDYHDLQSLFFALNNRMTSIDNILDKHSDPILAVPEGVLDEKGEVKKEALGMFEVREGEGKPEYIVWNANLDIAFQQIDELIKMIFLMGEISPDVVGIDSKTRSGAESGRALKMRMLRTLAKKNRKALYYELALQKVVEIASMFAKKGHKVGDIGYKGDPIIPNITFADGIVDDKVEEIQNETLKYESELTSRRRAIMVLEDMDGEEADALIKEINKEKDGKTDIPEESFHLRARTNELQGIDEEGGQS